MMNTKTENGNGLKMCVILQQRSSVVSSYSLQSYRRKRFLETAEESLDFLGKITFKDGYFNLSDAMGGLKKVKSRLNLMNSRSRPAKLF